VIKPALLPVSALLGLQAFCIPVAHAYNVWDYARDREQRRETLFLAPEPAEQQPTQEITAPPRRVMPAKPERKSPSAPLRDEVSQAVKPATDAALRSELSQCASEQYPAAPQLPQPNIAIADKAVEVGRWVNTLWRAVRGLPDDKTLQANWHETKAENEQLVHERAALNDTLLQQQQTIERLESDLLASTLRQQEASLDSDRNDVTVLAHELNNDDAARAGLWLKNLVNRLSATPDERALREAFLAMKEQKEQLSDEHQILDKKFQTQQNTLHLLQRKLKEAQSPSIPKEPERREGFAAGMAAGFGLIDLLESRQALGLNLQKDDFIAGVMEAANGGKRLSATEFDDLLAKVTEKLRVAQQKQQQRRESKDLQWKTAFSREAGSKVTKNGIWYQLVYSGDRHLDDDEILIVDLSRRNADGTLLEDSAISGNFLQARKKDFPDLLYEVINQLNLHGEARAAIPVNGDGTPDSAGPYYESWTLRIADAEREGK